MIAKTAKPNLIGTAFAIYYGIDGLVLFASNNIAGLSGNFVHYLGLTSSSGPFICGILGSLTALIFTLNWLKKERLF